MRRKFPSARSADSPPAFPSSSPLTARIESRIASASNRFRLIRQNSRLSGSFAIPASDPALDARYVSERTISRINPFTEYPDARNRPARYSSNSRFPGLSPISPKLDGVRTIPAPNSQPQIRFTITRDANGLSTIACANCIRPLPSPSADPPNTVKNRRGTISPKSVGFPRLSSGKSIGSSCSAIPWKYPYAAGDAFFAAANSALNPARCL